jgi:predicted DNA-binding transcriptional regulator AlpA
MKPKEKNRDQHPTGEAVSRLEVFSLNTLSTDEAASYLGLSPQTLRRGRMEGCRDNRVGSPPYIKIGKSVRYLRSDLDAWIASHRVSGGSG